MAKAKFDPAYAGVRKWEGNGVYAWLANDKGGETYGGIARVSNPKWDGWIPIDFEKHRRNVDKLPNGTKIAGMDAYVEKFYRDLWDTYKLGNLVSQDIANLVFDFLVNSGPGNVEKVVGPIVGAKKLSTIMDLLNTGDAAKTYQQIKNARIDFLNAIVKRDPSQQVFLKGWLNRVASFPDLSTGIKLAGGGLIIIFIVATIIILSIGKA